MKMRRIYTQVMTIIAVAMLAAPSATQTLSEQAKTELTKGEQILDAGNVTEAQKQLKSVIENYPSTEWAWWARVRLSGSYLRQKNYDETILEARKVVNQYPLETPQLAAAWAQLNIGLAYLAKKDVDSGIWELERVEQLLGDNADKGPLMQAKINLALTYHGRNERKKSVELANNILAESTAKDADRAWAYAILGTSLVGDKKTEEGLSALRKAKELYPDQQEQLLLAEKKILDKQYIANHDYDGAIKEGYSIAEDPRACEPRARQARLYIALACLYKQDYSAAISECQSFLSKYIAPGSDIGQIYSIKARAHAMLKDYSQAISSLEAALATGSADKEFNAIAEWDIATCYRAKGDKENARLRYQRLIDLYPKSHLALRAARELAR
jgi:tetratricopeptide (TPR) repeat protein